MTATLSPRCATHLTERATACFSCYLSQPCDGEGCDRTAVYNGQHRDAPHAHGKFCQSCVSWDLPAFSRDD